MNDYEDDVIEAARIGFKDGWIVMDETMEKLLRLIYRAGHKQGTVDALAERIAELNNE